MFVTGLLADEDAAFDVDVRGVEKVLEVEEEEGVVFEPFNFEDERKEGYFDEEGHYVWKDEKQDIEDVKDAWLNSHDCM